MYIKFDTLRFKNVNSYGNTLTTFDFKKGINSISGENGQGKSSILEALCFCLFGVPYRKVRIKEIINRTNRRGLFTQVTFSIRNERYQITRCLNPYSFDIQKNGESLELLSTKRLTQEEVDKLLGIDVTLFRQIISLAINANKPFLSLSAKEKRDIVETIFNIKVFGVMLKTVKQNMSGVKGDYGIQQKTIKMLETNILELRKQVKDIEYTEANFQQDKEKELKFIDKNIKSLEYKIKQGNSKIERLQKSEKFFDEKKFKFGPNDRQRVAEEIGKLEYKIRKGKKDLKFFETNDSCPVCLASLKDGTVKDDHINRITARVKNDEGVLALKLKEKKSIEDSIDLKKRNEEKINSIKEQIKIENEKLKMNTEQMENYKKTRVQTEAKQFTFDIDKIRALYESKKKEYKTTFKKTTELSKELTMFETICNILGTEGIKSHFFAKLIPILNQKINEYLTTFDLPISLTFNEFMEEKIYVFGEKFQEIPYLAFSEGEKKRIDIAILLSFIETTKVISNWSSNVLIFDEIFDGSTDAQAINKIMESIKDMYFQDPNLCLYIMSHRTLELSFHNKYVAKKVGGFSSIVKEAD